MVVDAAAGPDDKTELLPGQSPAANAPSRLGKYVLRREIGRGGMGLVMEAEDPELKRTVALKIVREGDVDPEFIARLRREASIAAQLQHPNIVGIHEVGTARDGTTVHHFIAMDYVAGRTLAAVLKEGAAPREELLRMLEDVARAVAHAHSKGVVHRDLKPSNVLVDATGRVFLTDFGLARAESFKTQLTQSNVVMGTPQYMAPEQVEARMSDIDARTDVYALGVILYEILVGRVPFKSEMPLQLYDQIAREEPVPPSRIARSVGRDLEVVCLKALEKDRARRYPGALEFAEDIARARRGEPILARPPSLLAVLSRRVVRRKTAVLAVTAVAAAAAAVVLVLLLRSERRRAVEELRKRADVALAAALDLRRAGNLAAMKRYGAALTSACCDVTDSHPQEAEPHYFLGRMHRALGDETAALAEQERALERNPHLAPALYERIVLVARLYHLRASELRERVWGEEVERMISIRPGRSWSGLTRLDVPLAEILKGDAEARLLRERLEADARELEALGGVGPGELANVRGLVARVRGETDRARAQLTSAFEAAPFLEEAHEALATLEMEEGDPARSIELWTKGIERDAGYLPHREGRAFARVLWSVQKQTRGEDPTELHEAAARDYSDVLAKDPSRHEARRRRGVVHVRVAGYEAAQGRDATAALEAAKQDFDEVLKGTSGADHRAWIWRGLVVATLGALEIWQGKDPVPRFEAAVRDLTEAIARSPGADEGFIYRAFVHATWVICVAVRGGDPEPRYQEAIRDAEQALKLNADRVNTRLWRGTANWLWGIYLAGRGRDPSDTYRWAIEDMGAVLEKVPGLPEARVGRARIRLSWCAYKADHGQDPSSLYAEALSEAEQVSKDVPRHPDGWAACGSVRAQWAAYRGAREDVDALFEAAVRDFDRAVALNEAAPELRVGRADARIRWAACRAERGQPAEQLLEEAIAELDQVDARGAPAVRSQIATARGRARTLLAAHLARQGRDPFAMTSAAIFDLVGPAAFNVLDAGAKEYLGDALAQRGAWQASRGRNAQGDYRAALKQYTDAIRINPALEAKLRPRIVACEEYLRAHDR